MAKLCIICGNRAGSNEHIFPASFGGKRTNKGIYCGRHNKAFGRHVSALLTSLDIVNAAIGVIPDGANEVRPAAIQSATGQKMLLRRGVVTLAPPLPLDATPERVGVESVFPFDSVAQAEKWIADQREAGYAIQVGKRGAAQARLLSEPLNVKRVLGDDPFRRGILYLALTFLAHRYGGEAKTPGVKLSRDIVENDLQIEDKVWWLRPETIKQLSTNPFEHGHTIAIAVNGTTKQVTALVSLYGAIHLGVNLGDSERSVTSLAITHIDPLAAKPPNDIVEVFQEGATLILGSPEDGHRYLAEFTSGQAAHPFEKTFRVAGDAELRKASEALLSKLTTSWALPLAERSEALMALLSEQDQRILFLFKGALVQFERVATDIPPEFHQALKTLALADDHAPRGISSASEAMLQVMKAFMADEIRKQLEVGGLSVEWLAEMMSGRGPFGAAFVGVITQVANGFTKARSAAS
jgi:hypothetical protein